jgi:hypothetical protein
LAGEDAERMKMVISGQPLLWSRTHGMEEPMSTEFPLAPHFAADVPHSTAAVPPASCAVIQGDNNTTNINMDNTKVFNLSVYLAEECRDAPNLKDFVAGVVASFKDIDYENDRQTWDYAEKLAHMPYAEGVSKLLADKLGELDQVARPIQCSDEKRHRFHVKNDEVWHAASLEDAVGTPFRDAIYQLGQIRAGYALQWKLRHGSDESLDAERTNILRNVSSGVSKKQTDASRRAIASQLAKDTTIDKGNVI